MNAEQARKLASKINLQSDATKLPVIMGSILDDIEHQATSGGFNATYSFETSPLRIAIDLRNKIKTELSYMGYTVNFVNGDKWLYIQW